MKIKKVKATFHIKKKVSFSYYMCMNCECMATDTNEVDVCWAFNNERIWEYGFGYRRVKKCVEMFGRPK